MSKNKKIFKTRMVLDVVNCKKEPNHYVYHQSDMEFDFIVPPIRIFRDYFINAPEEIILTFEGVE